MSKINIEGLTDEQIANEINSKIDQINFLEKDQITDLLKKPQVFEDLLDDALSEFNQLLTGLEDITEVVTELDLSNFIDSLSERVSQVLNISDFLSPDKALELLQNLSIDQLIDGGRGLLSQLQTSQLQQQIEDITRIGPLVGQINFLDTITHGSQQFDALLGAIPEQFNDAYKEFFTTISQVGNQLSDISFGDFLNLTDIGYRFTNGTGLKANTGHFLKYSQGSVPPYDPETPGGDLTSADRYESLKSSLTSAIGQGWQTRNSKPGNPLILEAYAINGRNYDRDGTTGEYNWNAAFVGYVLNKAGIDHPEAMTPNVYSQYGKAVSLHNKSDFRKYDIAIFETFSTVGLVGFIKNYDAESDTLTVIGGNFSGNVGEREIKLNGKGRGAIRLTHVRRNWTVTGNDDQPFFKKTDPQLWYRI
jgi:hypothetical protein